MKNNRQLHFALFAVVLLFSLIIGIVVYYDDLLSNLQESTCSTLEEILLQEKNSFTQTLQSNQEELKGFAQLITLSLSNDLDLNQVMNALVLSDSFEYITFAQPDGTAINNRGEFSNLYDRAYFQQALAGETVLSEPLQSKVRDAHIIAIATPVLQDHQVVGVLVGSITTTKLNALFTLSFEGYGYTYVAANDGTLISNSNSEYARATNNLFDLYREAEFFKKDSYETLRQNLLVGVGGHAQYRFEDGEQRLMHYGKLPINDWNIFVVASPQNVESNARQILKNAILMTLGLLVVFILLLLYNFYSQKRFTQALQKMAYEDEVTGYHSFGKFKIDASSHLNRHIGLDYLLVKMDIENFKLINEFFSVETGNQILRALAASLASALDEKFDVFGRIHADEFVLLISYTSEAEWQEKIQRFETQFETVYELLIDYKLTLAYGRYKLNKKDCDFSEIYEKVNFAHKLAKRNSKKQLDFDGQVKEASVRQKMIERRMEEALSEGEYALYLQPKYRLSDRKIIGAEALVRWCAPDQPMMLPDEFIPIFEQNGFITNLDFYMFEKVCRTLRRWIDGDISPIPLSVNFSELHLSKSSFVDELCRFADQYELPHHLLEIELTETSLLHNLDVRKEILLRIHEAGFMISLDDFGIGHSSLELLKNSSVDIIKINRWFFDNCKDMNRAKIVIGCVLDMAQKLGIHTVAEGVNSPEYVNLLNTLGCEAIQCYDCAEPMPAELLEVKLLRNAFLPS